MTIGPDDKGRTIARSCITLLCIGGAIWTVIIAAIAKAMGWL